MPALNETSVRTCSKRYSLPWMIVCVPLAVAAVGDLKAEAQYTMSLDSLGLLHALLSELLVVQNHRPLLPMAGKILNVVLI